MKNVKELKVFEMQEIQIVEGPQGEYKISVRCLNGKKAILLVIDTKSKNMAYDFFDADIKLMN
jgi:hypothetical protein